MRRIFATAAVAGIMTLGLGAAPAQAATTTQSSHTTISACSAVKIVLVNFRTIEVAGNGSSRDNLLNRNDLRTVVRDGAPIHVRKAAIRLKGPLFDRLDTAAYGGHADGLISPDDLRAFFKHVCA